MEPPDLDRRLQAATRLDELADTAELMGDQAGADRFREEATGHRMQTMHLLDD